MIDVWPEVTRDGHLRPEYELDGVHLSREANLISLRALIEHALNNTPPIRNVERYRLLHEMATGTTGHVYDLSTGMNSCTCFQLRRCWRAGGARLAAEICRRRAVASPPPGRLRASLGGMKRLVAPFIPAPARAGLRSSLGRMKRLAVRFTPRPAPAIANGAAAAPFPESEKAEEPVETIAAPPMVSAGSRTHVEKSAACEPESDDPFVRAARTFRAEWVCSLDLGRELAEKWRNSVDYRWELANRHARLDWAGNGLAPNNDYIRTAEPTAEFLDEIRGYFSSERFTRFFHDCFGCLVTFLNFRPFMSLPHEDKGVGPQSWHQDGCPPGVFRAVIYLTDVDADAGPFEYLDADKKRRSVTGPSGAFLLFDANRLLHRGSPPKRTERKVLDIVIAPRADGQPFTVLWTGLNNWPGDPFQYSVNGMKASPPLTGAEISFKPRAAA